MKNKLFLTSMLALMVACPAYAELTTDPGSNPPTQSGYINYDGTNYDSADESCAADPLTSLSRTHPYGTYYLTADWTANSCDVTYNATSHSANSSATTSNTATYDSPYSKPSDLSTISAPATGYSFVGWSTSQNPTVTRIGATTGTLSPEWTWTDGTNWTSTTCPILYAAYIANQCDVTYNATSHSANSSATTSNTATYDSAYSKPSNLSTISAPATGYSFVGWSTSQNPTVTRIGATTGTLSPEWTWTDGTNWASTTCPTLYAAYIANQYNVTYDCTANGGNLKGTYATDISLWTSGNIGVDSVIFNNTNYTARNAVDVCEKTGYDTSSTWSCYETNDSTNVVNLPFAQPWALPYDVTCEANYGVSDYTISYDCGTYGSPAQNVSGQAPATTTHSYLGSWALATQPGTCAQAGYSFAGWHCTVNPATGQTDSMQNYANFAAIIPTSGALAGQYAVANANSSQISGASYNYAGNIVCTAQWMMNRVYLKWYNDEDTYNNTPNNPDTTNSCNYGDDTITIPTEPTKTGYTFNGWKVVEWDNTTPANP